MALVVGRDKTIFGRIGTFVNRTPFGGDGGNKVDTPTAEMVVVDDGNGGGTIRIAVGHFFGVGGGGICIHCTALAISFLDKACSICVISPPGRRVDAGPFFLVTKGSFDGVLLLRRRRRRGGFGAGCIKERTLGSDSVMARCE